MCAMGEVTDWSEAQRRTLHVFGAPGARGCCRGSSKIDFWPRNVFLSNFPHVGPESPKVALTTAFEAGIVPVQREGFNHRFEFERLRNLTWIACQKCEFALI